MTAGQEQLLGLILTALAVIFIPMFLSMIRIIKKWTVVEIRLEELAKDMRQLVDDKEKVHNEMIRTMTTDRAATDTRLRELEKEVWRKLCLMKCAKSKAMVMK